MRRRRVAGVGAWVLIAAVAVAGCGGDSASPITGPDPTPTPTPPIETPPTPPAATTVFTGVVTGPSLSGSLTLTVQGTVGASPYMRVSPPTPSAEVLQVTGTFDTATLSGTYDDETGVVTLSGGGYSLEATISADGLQISGSFHGPGGALGAFVGFSTVSAPATAYCGTWGVGESASGGGHWNLVIAAGGQALGHYSDDDGGGAVSGQLSGNSFTATFSYPGGGGTAAGTLDGTSLAGTWTNPGTGVGGRWMNVAGCS